MQSMPRVAVLLDENTSEDASRYEATKSLFNCIKLFGGVPFGVPYLPEVVVPVLEDFDGLLCGGGRFAYPDGWYIDGKVSLAPRSDRLAIELALVEGCLVRGKPILGLCAGMQLLAGVFGCRLWADVRSAVESPLNHDDVSARHTVTIERDSRLGRMTGVGSLEVNSSHQEAVGEVSDRVCVSARAGDGVIEAIEVPGEAFAMGLQWHQERLAETEHAGNQVFRGFVAACREARGS